MSLSLHLNLKNVTHLIKIFELKSCLKLEKEHRVLAIINDAIFQKILSLSSLINAKFLIIEILSKFQLLQFIRLNCLHERHRIVATQQILLFKNK